MVTLCGASCRQCSAEAAEAPGGFKTARGLWRGMTRSYARHWLGRATRAAQSMPLAAQRQTAHAFIRSPVDPDTGCRWKPSTVATTVQGAADLARSARVPFLRLAPRHTMAWLANLHGRRARSTRAGNLTAANRMDGARRFLHGIGHPKWRTLVPPGNTGTRTVYDAADLPGTAWFHDVFAGHTDVAARTTFATMGATTLDAAEMLAARKEDMRQLGPRRVAAIQVRGPRARLVPYLWGSEAVNRHVATLKPKQRLLHHIASPEQLRYELRCLTAGHRQYSLTEVAKGHRLRLALLGLPESMLRRLLGGCAPRTTHALYDAVADMRLADPDAHRGAAVPATPADTCAACGLPRGIGHNVCPDCGHDHRIAARADEHARRRAALRRDAAGFLEATDALGPERLAGARRILEEGLLGDLR